MADLGLERSPPRQHVWEDEQIAAFIDYCERRRRPSIGLAVDLGANIAQRLSDILALSWNQYQDGCFVIRQQKTGAIVAVPVVDDLKARLDRTPRTSPIIVTAEGDKCHAWATNQPYRRPVFSIVFRKLTRMSKIRDVDGLQFRDLRRTAIVNMSRAGCTPQEIASVSGHSINTVAAMLRIYSPPDSTQARHAMNKVVQFRARKKLEDL